MYSYFLVYLVFAENVSPSTAGIVMAVSIGVDAVATPIVAYESGKKE